MPSIEILFDEHQFFPDTYTSLAEAVMLQHCENYFSICRQLKKQEENKNNSLLQNQLLDEMDYFVHGRFERDLSIMCNGNIPTTGDRALSKLDDLVENTIKYPSDTIDFFIP